MWTRSRCFSLLILVFVLPVSAEAQDHSRPSAFRFPHESALEARARNGVDVDEAWDLTALTEAGPIEELNRRLIPEWPNGTRQEAFSEIRNHSSLRSAWEFAYDGCFARAAIASQVLEEAGFRRPAKLFIFGELSLQTASAGSLTWWYHVAPVITEKGRIYVLDPAVERKKALPLREWVSRLTRDPDAVSVIVCNPFSYDPWSPCYISGPEAEAQAEGDLAAFNGNSGS